MIQLSLGVWEFMSRFNQFLSHLHMLRQVEDFLVIQLFLGHHISQGVSWGICSGPAKISLVDSILWRLPAHFSLELIFNNSCSFLLKVGRLDLLLIDWELLEIAWVVILLRLFNEVWWRDVRASPIVFVFLRVYFFNITFGPRLVFALICSRRFKSIGVRFVFLGIQWGKFLFFTAKTLTLRWLFWAYQWILPRVFDSWCALTMPFKLVGWRPRPAITPLICWHAYAKLDQFLHKCGL